MNEVFLLVILALVICFLVFLSVVLVDFFSCMIIDMIYPSTKNAFHNPWTNIGFMFTHFGAHITCVVFLRLMCFVLGRIICNFTVSSVMDVCFTKDAVYCCKSTP